MLDYMDLVKVIPGAIVGLTIHEFAHALMASVLGDRTARDEGRLTLNPLKHIDPLGFIMILVAGFGWAKPVRFNPDNLKRKAQDEILISLAGPFSNLFFGFIILMIARGLLFSGYFLEKESSPEIIMFLIVTAAINFGLFLFNLLPVPPLDGSHLYTPFIREKNPELAERISRFGFYALLGIMVVQVNLKIRILNLSAAINFITRTCMELLGFS